MLFEGQNEKASHITERIKNTKVIIWKGRLRQELIQQQKPLSISAWFCDIVQVWKKNKNAFVSCLCSFVKAFLCFAFESALHIIATGEVFERNSIPLDIWRLRCPQQIGMVLYGPPLMPSACSWFQNCKEEKAEGRKAIFPPSGRATSWVVSFAHVLRTSLTQNYLCHFCMDWWNLWGSDFLNLNWALAPVFSRKSFPQLCKVSELFACFPGWSEDCSRWPNV